jgi:hypothetical protein
MFFSAEDNHLCARNLCGRIFVFQEMIVICAGTRILKCVTGAHLPICVFGKLPGVA